MLELANFLDRRFVTSFDPWELEFMDVLTWGRRTRFMGYVVKDDLVVLDWKQLASFRVKVSNLAAFMPKGTYLGKRQQESPHQEDYIAGYLDRARDNPFAVWNVMQSMAMEVVPAQLTEYPPLMGPKGDFNKRFDELLADTQAGDAPFSFNRASGLHNLIRRYDWGMWAHVAVYDGNGMVYEVTTSGVVHSSIEHYRNPSFDLGLYRIGDDLTPEQVEKMREYCRKHLGQNGYPWWRVIRIAFSKNARYPYRRKKTEATSANMMNSNRFRLIAYA